MGLMNRNPGWIACAMLAVALGCAVSVAAATPARHAAPALPAASASKPVTDSRCVDDEGADPASAPQSHTVPVNASSTPLAPAARDPRQNLLDLVQRAIRRSNAVGASHLLSEAAADDIDEASAGRLPQVSLNSQIGGIDGGSPGAASARGAQFQGGLTATTPIYDGGRVRDLTDWRTHLSEAARFGEITAQEQVALQTVSLALERSRYTVESEVYGQYAHKMGCLVGALQTIVTIDRGRTSELVQARKTQQQAELSRDQSLSQKRLAEIRLSRFVGNDLPPTDGITSVMLDTPALPDLLTLASHASEIASLDAQASALDSYVRAVLDGQKPQIGVLLQATRLEGAGSSRSVSGGITLSVPLYNPSTTYTANGARHRAQAAKLQRDDALEARMSRMTEVHEQAEHAMDRARSIVEILHNSELVRNFTLQQWQQLGKRSLFDVMAAEGDHYNMRVQYIDALYDTQQSNALLWSLGLGLAVHLQ